MGGKRNDFYEQLNEFLANVKGERVDIAASVYFMLAKEEDAGSKLRYFLENADEIESSESMQVEKYFLPAQIGDLREKCSGLVNETLGKLIKENLDENDFYCRLWEKGIQENTMLEEESQKIFALYYIWRDDRIPYFKLEEGMKMSNEDFREISLSRQEQIEKAIFIISNEFSQRTEKASLLNHVLEDCETEKEKAVLMAQILNLVEKKTIQRLMNMRRSETESESEET